MVLVNHSSSGVQLHVIVDVNWSLIGAKVWFWFDDPTKSSHVCKGNVGHDILAINCLLD